jgi:hypothetical protein
MNPEIEYSVTGGPVKECYLLPLEDGSDAQGLWASEAEEDDDDSTTTSLRLKLRTLSDRN